MTQLDQAPTDVAPDGRLTPLAPAGRAALFTDARTAGAYTDTPVTEEELHGIWELARWAPTSANTQPLRVLFVQSPEARARLVERMADGNRARTAAAPAVAVLARDLRFHDQIPTVMPAMPQLHAAMEADEGRRTAMGSYSSAMQAGYFVLAVRAAGLAAGPMGGFDAAGVDADFFAGGDWHAELVVTIGHPAPDAYRPRLPRLAADEVLRFV